MHDVKLLLITKSSHGRKSHYNTIFWISFVQAGEVHAHPLLAIGFLYYHNIFQLVEMYRLLNESVDEKFIAFHP